jgi:hypothetical protein
MITDGDKMAAATMAAAMLPRIESSGNLGETVQTQTRAVQRAAALYREILAAIELKSTGATASAAAAAAASSAAR